MVHQSCLKNTHRDRSRHLAAITGFVGGNHDGEVESAYHPSALLASQVAEAHCLEEDHHQGHMEDVVGNLQVGQAKAGSGFRRHLQAAGNRHRAGPLEGLIYCVVGTFLRGGFRGVVRSRGHGPFVLDWHFRKEGMVGSR